MADAVGIGEKTEKSDSPKIPARATHIYEAWKIEASSEHALRGTRHGHRRAGKSRGLRFSAPCHCQSRRLREFVPERQHSQRQKNESAGQSKRKDRNKDGRIRESAHKDEKFLIPGTRSGFSQKSILDAYCFRYKVKSQSRRLPKPL